MVPYGSSRAVTFDPVEVQKIVGSPVAEFHDVFTLRTGSDIDNVRLAQLSAEFRVAVHLEIEPNCRILASGADSFLGHSVTGQITLRAFAMADVFGWELGRRRRYLLV